MGDMLRGVTRATTNAALRSSVWVAGSAGVLGRRLRPTEEPQPATAKRRPRDVSQSNGGASNEELARRAQTGDRAAWAELYNRTRPWVLTVAGKRLADVQSAEDVTQTILLKAQLHLDQYDPGRPFKRWLSTIAKRAIVDELRRRQRAAARTRHLDDPAGADPDMSKQLHRKEALQALSDCLASVSAEDRWLLMGSATGFSQNDLAQMMGMSKSGIGSRLHNAREQVRRCMAGRGFTDI